MLTLSDNHPGRCWTEGIFLDHQLGLQQLLPSRGGKTARDSSLKLYLYIFFGISVFCIFVFCICILRSSIGFAAISAFTRRKDSRRIIPEIVFVHLYILYFCLYMIMREPTRKTMLGGLNSPGSVSFKY